jgi:type II secretory pathway pseudopilin PulG
MQQLLNRDLRRVRREKRAFTMIEIALSIAVVAFALVAIIGVLPTGMTVQKDNREDTVISQEGRYWMQLIKSGALGLQDITNYVESITVSNLTKPNLTYTVINGPGGKALTPTDVIALLSTPKYDYDAKGNPLTNRVTARVKAITGPAAEKGSLTNESSFRYELQSEIVPTGPLLLGATNLTRASLIYDLSLRKNLHEVRLILRWPLMQRGNEWIVGGNRRTFRGTVAGTYIPATNLNSSLGRTDLFVLAPNKFEVNVTNLANARF